MGQHDEDKDGHKPNIDPKNIAKPPQGDGGKHGDKGGKGEGGKK